jgi:hypothetical protein
MQNSSQPLQASEGGKLAKQKRKKILRGSLPNKNYRGREKKIATHN